jgi:outer membrane protein TolC
MLDRRSTSVTLLLAGVSAMMSKRVLGSALVGALALTGCASYTPEPLDREPHLHSQVSALAGATNKPITPSELDRLILANNPELRAARARLGLGEAQVIEAGLLPNPQIAFSYPFFVAGPDGSDAFSAGLAQDLKSILLRPTKREVAANAALEINASLLWQEWQTIGKARILFVDIVSSDHAEKFIQRTRKLLKERFDLTAAAIDQGNATLATLSPDLVAVGDVQKTYDDLERQQLSRRHQLNALLGLAPDAPLPLAGASEVPRVDAQRIRRNLVSLADRRPDLIALQYGYRSEDAKLRQAILAQFPNVTIGLAGGRDSSAIYSVGPQVSFDLPIFDRNEGAIARETATREALNREFNARLTAATGEVDALLSEQALLARQFAAIEPRLRQARMIAEKSETAFKQNLLDERAYVDTQVAQLALEQEKIGLQQAMLDGQAALATLTGAGLPRVAIEPEAPPADIFGLFQPVSR